MKIKKLTYMPIIAMLFLFVAWGCSTEDLVEPRSDTESSADTKLYIPVISGTVGEFTDEDITTTKAGCIEENDKYAEDGEKFYWMEGDKFKLLFFRNGNLTTEPTELIYKTLATDGKKSSCDFEFDSGEGLEAGKYTVYALYPADGWIYEDGVYRIKTLEEVFVQEDATSKSMGKYMYMKAKAVSIEIEEGEDYNKNPILLNFKHLMSIMRINVSIPDKDLHPNRKFLNLKFEIEAVKNGIPLNDKNPFFMRDAYLESLNDSELTTVKKSGTFEIGINASDNFPGNDEQFTFFMPVLPTRKPRTEFKPPVLLECLTITGTMSDSGNIIENKIYKRLRFDVPEDGSANVSFLNLGFRSGYSYYFNLTMKE